MTLDEVLARLHGVQRTGSGATAFCPAHDDRTKRSLSVSIGRDGRLLVKCFTGCSAGAITAALGLTLRDLMPERSSFSAPARRIVATYNYTDESGTRLYQVVRYEPKDFRPRQEVSGAWVYGLPESIRRVVYRLQDLAEQTRVVWTEGEKDADRLWALGVTASTSQGGAAAWRDDYVNQLVAAGCQELVTLPDHDQAGERYAQAVARAGLAAGLVVKLIRLPDVPHKGDVSDWLDAGHTADELGAIIATTPTVQPG